MPSTDPAVTVTPRRRWPRVLAALALALALAGGLIVYGCAGELALRREIRATPRDPETGIVLGAEPRTLSPADSPPTGEDRSAPSHTRAVLLMHGFIGSPRDFADLPERLAARGFHVRAMLHAGHGTTPRDFNAQTPDTMMAHALTELAALRAEHDDITVVGFSMGGTMATLMAAEGLVDRVVLVAPYYRVSYQWYYYREP